MATEELVTEQFQFLGIEVQKDVLRKCVSLCEEYNVDPETFIEQWMAFSLTNLNGAAPSIDNLNLLETREFSKNNASKIHVLANETARSSTGASLPIYSAAASAQSENEVLSNYMTTTPKRIKVEKEQVSIQQNEICPATYSPTVGSSVKYTSRTNQGSVVHSYGQDSLLQKIDRSNDLNLTDLNITQVGNDDGELYSKAMFGFEFLHEKASTFDNHIRYISQCIMKKNGLSETTSVTQKTQTEVFVAGRIECDADARLNAKSVLLQGTWENSLSNYVTVDMDNLKQYSLFPGQVVVMRGINPRGDKFIAHEVFHDGARPMPDRKADLMNILKDTLSLVIAAGPYTTSNSMGYEPLKDLITYINTHRPQVVIMTGPFLDAEHANVKDNSMAETYKSFFEKLIDSLGEICVSSPHTKIYIGSSLKDAFHVNIYPTPPYSVRKKHPNIHFIPDPCTLNINGVMVGVTGTDVLMHISQEEISLGTGGDKLARLASHILTQQSFYPLWPPPASHPVDASLWAAHAQLPCTPHVLVLPSNFRYFVKEVNGCVVVNPEHLTKGTGGGTFARMIISDDNDLSKSIAVQILRI
ncbi:DNA polymerase alpha subunit B isoform X1 [Colias croceus]|uniref:DNA polymerase alpha subunit B isoform X1 n=1 Tax=Colias crocea TaxID=72248 RepID=UPI001E27FC09|nr:DNA polymerase alpha subunit B isoform X1 [Colias croceus]